MTVQTTWNGANAAKAAPRNWRNWARKALSAERDRLVLWLPVALGIGIASYFTLAYEPPPLAGPALVAAALMVLVLSARRFRYVVPAIALCIAALGFAAAQWRTHDVAAPVIAKELRHRIVTGDIVSVEPRGGRVRLTVDVAQIAGLNAAETPERVRISASAGQYGGVRPGQRVIPSPTDHDR